DALECSGAGRTGERVFVQRAFLERDLVKRAFNVVIGIDFAVSLRFFQRALDRLVALVGREHAHHALLGGAPLVEPDADTDLAVAFSPRRVVGLDFAQRAPLEVGQFEILEHDLDQFLERDVGLVIVNARPVAGALVAFAGAVLAGFADDLPGPRVAVTLRRAGRVVAEDETVFLDSAQRNLDDAVPVFADDRFFGDDVGDIFADRLTHLLAVAQPVAGRAIGAFGVGDPVFAEDCVTAAHRLLSPSSILPQIVCRVLEHDVHARFAVAVLEQVFHHRAVLLALLLVAGARLGDDARDVADAGHQLFLDRFLERLVALV